MNRCTLLPFLFGLAFTFSCAHPSGPFIAEEIKLPADPDGPDGYTPLDGYEAMEIPADNPLTPMSATLGKELYFDTRLSGDGSRSCYSCHVCEKGLTDGLPTAIGAYEKKLSRSSPTLWNIGFHSEFYWDGRATSLEGQAAAAWKGGNMGASDAQAIVDYLNSLPGYREQFEVVFGEPATTDNVPKALASYMRTIIGGNTAWDRWMAGDESAMSESAQRGFEVFKEARCTLCHVGVLMTDQQFHNVGIGMDAAEPDVGRYKVTGLEKNMGAFKTPTLRDISKSAPYFHNGSVATLEEAVQLMLAGGLPNPHLDAFLKPAEISEQQFADLMAFLRSLDEPCDGTAPPLP
ncbi:MAG: cytochrome c peroxidase [Planctomycetota bacterium]|nr:cytochrome c peroxidase [Planctomycetota bacterium]